MRTGRDLTMGLRSEWDECTFVGYHSFVHDIITVVTECKVVVPFQVFRGTVGVKSLSSLL